MAERPPIPEDLVPFIESGVSILVGTRDAQKRPHGMRAVGVRVLPDRRTLTVYLPDATAAQTLADLRDNGRAALTFTRPIDHRSMQLKGRAGEPRACREDERSILERYVEAWAGHVEVVGLPRALGARLTFWPATAIDVGIETIFHQTPGPSAGTPMATGRA